MGDMTVSADPHEAGDSCDREHSAPKTGSVQADRTGSVVRIESW
jgi:hypothetical protein